MSDGSGSPSGITSPLEHKPGGITSRLWYKGTKRWARTAAAG
jgi:hypothetical protein